MTLLQPAWVDTDLSTFAAQSILDDAIAAAVRSGEGLRVDYQPIFDRFGVNVAVEALVRWSVQGELVPAPLLIDACRRHGLLAEMGRRVHRLALSSFALHTSLGFAPPRLALNVTVEEMYAPGYCSSLLEMLREEGVSPEAVIVELTEDSPTPQTPQVRACMRALRSAGVTVSLDDFGSGSNGLMALRAMIPTQLKLDKGFLQHLVPGDVMIAGIVTTAHAMGVEVVAEGVETKEQAQILADLGCDLFQGFYLGRPGFLPALHRPITR